MRFGMVSLMLIVFSAQLVLGGLPARGNAELGGSFSVAAEQGSYYYKSKYEGVVQGDISTGYFVTNGLSLGGMVSGYVAGGYGYVWLGPRATVYAPTSSKLAPFAEATLQFIEFNSDFAHGIRRGGIGLGVLRELNHNIGVTLSINQIWQWEPGSDYNKYSILRAAAGFTFFLHGEGGAK